MVVDQRAANSKQAGLAIHGNLDIPVLIALLRSCDEMLEAILDPFDRPLEDDGAQRNADVFGVENELRSEAAAHIRGHDADRVLVETQHVAKHAQCGVRHLGRGPHRQTLIVRVACRNGSAALDRVTPATMLPKGFLEYVPRRRERSLYVAVSHREFGKEVVRRSAVDGGRTRGKCRLAIRSRRQRLPIHLDQLGCILRDIAIFSHDHGNRLSNMNRLVPDERWPVQVLLVVLARQAHHHELVAQMRQQVISDQHRVHPLQSERGILANAANQSVSVRAAHECGLQHARHVQIVDKAALSPQQRLVLQPRHRAADETHLALLPATRSTASTMPW